MAHGTYVIAFFVKSLLLFEELYSACDVFDPLLFDRIHPKFGIKVSIPYRDIGSLFTGVKS